MVKANEEVYKAVRAGALYDVKTLICVDCADQASCYDHRDYLKVFDVDPVCTRCNKLRGEGLNKLLCP